MPILIRQVVLKNYKSIKACKVDLRGISILVGPNGSGKSNFIDAMRLISDALNSTLEYALRQRGGIKEVRRRSGGHPTNFTISIKLDLGGNSNALYAVRVSARPEGAFSVQREEARISTNGLEEAHFVVEEAQLISASQELSAALPKVSGDRLFLTAISGVSPFRTLFDALAEMRFYSISPEPIKELQVHDAGERLDRSGWNLSAVIKRLAEEQRDSLDRIREYLQQIVPGIQGVEHKAYGPRETLEFLQAVQGQPYPWRFHAANMSDGTLRSLGVLTALFHPSITRGQAAPFVAIEEPEITIHPGAASIIMDALVEAARKEQIVTTTHSPDLLDHQDIQSEWILAVRNDMGETRISPVDAAAVEAIKNSLYTAGELLRSGQLFADLSQDSDDVKELDLFPHSI